LEYAPGAPGVGFRRRPHSDRRQVTIGNKQLMLNIEELSQPNERRTLPIILLPKIRPGLFLHLSEFFDQQLFFRLHMAIDRTRAHSRALSDRPKCRPIKTSLTKERSSGSPDLRATLSPSSKPAVIGTKRCAILLSSLEIASCR